MVRRIIRGTREEDMAIVCDNTKKTEYDLVIWEKSLIFACNKQIEVFILQNSKINFHIKIYSYI